MSSPAWARGTAAIFGFLAVALGAMGAHMFKATLAANSRVEEWKTAALYHLAHAVVLLVLAQRPVVPRAAFWLIAAGITIFSGTLYVLSLTNLRWLGAITPIGGLALMAGWIFAAWDTRRA